MNKHAAQKRPTGLIVLTLVVAAAVIILFVVVNRSYSADQANDPSAPAASVTAPPPPSSSAPAPAAPAPPPVAQPPAPRTDAGWSAVAYRTEAKGGSATLSSIQTAQLTTDGTFNRLGLHFKNDILPGIAVEYVNKPADAPNLTGNAFMQITLLQAGLPATSAAQPSRNVSYSWTQLKSLAINGTPNSTIRIALGLNKGPTQQSVFRVIQDPVNSVIYIDLR